MIFYRAHFNSVGPPGVPPRSFVALLADVTPAAVIDALVSHVPDARDFLLPEHVLICDPYGRRGQIVKAARVVGRYTVAYEASIAPATITHLCVAKGYDDWQCDAVRVLMNMDAGGVREWAMNVGVSRRSLLRRFNDSGTPKRLVQLKRLLPAVEAVSRNGFTVRRTAAVLGWADQYTLSNMMKLVLGVRPSQLAPGVTDRDVIDLWIDRCEARIVGRHR